MQQANADKPTKNEDTHEAGHKPARGSVRFPMQLPLRLLTTTGVVECVTENLSAAGVLFEVEADLAEGSLVEFVLMMPAAVLGTPRDVEVRCVGRVVRRETDEKGRRLAAVSIDQYKLENGGQDGAVGD